MIVPNVGSRADFMRHLVFFEDDDGAGSGGSAPAGGTSEGGEAGGKPEGDKGKPDVVVLSAELEKSLADNAELRKLVEGELHGVKSALVTERADRKELEKSLKEKAEANAAVKFAEAGVNKALEEGRTEKEVTAQREELKTLKAELAKREARDVFRDEIRLKGQESFEDVLMSLRFGDDDSVKTTLERFSTRMQERVAAEITRRLPNSTPPEGGAASQEVSEPELEYPSMTQ